MSSKLFRNNGSESAYPTLKRSVLTGAVLLFTKPREGFVLHPGKSQYTIGTPLSGLSEDTFVAESGMKLVLE